MIAVFLADGFEEIEALSTVDILRRAALHVVTVGVGSAEPCGTHSITVKADIEASALSLDKLTAVVLPGGMPGALHLENSVAVRKAVDYAVEKGLPVAAICAAPSVLGHWGYLKGKKATCYPGFEEDLIDAKYCADSVVTDGNFITGKGAGVAVEFALRLVEVMAGNDKAETIRSGMQCQ